MSADRIKDSCFLVMSEYGIQRMTKRGGGLKRGEISVKVALTVPADCFAEPQVSVSIDVPDAAIIRPQVDVTVEQPID